MLPQVLQITATCCLHRNTFSELMFSTTTASGNPATLSCFLCDLVSFYRKAGLQGVELLRACLHSSLDLGPVPRSTDSTTHSAGLGLVHSTPLCLGPVHSTSVTKPQGHALDNDHHCARTPSAILENNPAPLWRYIG